MDEKQLIENLKQEHQEKVTGDFPSEQITLPSKGFFYPKENILSQGYIELKYPTAKEEDILTSKNLLIKGLALDRFMESIIIGDVDYNTLLLGDKNGIMYASRILAYGSQYDVQITCPSCGEINKSVSIDLAKIETRDFKFEDFQEGQQEFELDLPVSKKKILFKLLTHADEKSIETELKNIKKKNLSSFEAEVTTRLKYAVIGVEGERSRAVVTSFVDKMLSQDSLALRREISRCTPDLDSSFTFECLECGYSDTMDIPLGIGFFWPSGRL
ncbi:MAG TPA: hypothetical protein VMX17_00805 [Candidatus Glassbacteria bacterium]|nr:hypothetical protein [Candidatus Glassbacteria bacterium]